MRPENLCGKSPITEVREPKIFSLYLDPNVPGFPGMTITVSEFQLIETIRVLSQVYLIRITD